MQRGKGRKFVRAGWFVFLGVGIAYLILSRLAQMDGQPSNVHRPLLLIGIIETGMAGVAINLTRKYYERWEFRRMTSQDAGR